MTENSAKMNTIDTQLEFFNFDALSDDEVQKIKNFLKQPCTAVELPEFSYMYFAVSDEANGALDYNKNVPMMIPVEFTAAGTVTVSGHYSPQFSQAQLYTMATSVNGTSYIPTGYPMTTNVPVYMTKDYGVSKMINGMDVEASVAAVTSTGDAVLDGLQACIANSPTGGVVVSQNMYAHPSWGGMYPCAQYLLPHVPTFFTPIAPVHPSAMRAAGPSVTARADAYTSQTMAPSYGAVQALPQMSTMPVPIPSNLVTGPSQTIIVPTVITEESAAGLLCTKVEENLELLPSSVVALSPTDVYNGEMDAGIEYGSENYETEQPEVVYDLQGNLGEDIDASKAETDTSELSKSDYSSLECQEADKRASSPVNSAPNTASKSWASLFKASPPKERPSSSALVNVQPTVVWQPESSRGEPTSATEKSSTAHISDTLNAMPSVYQPESSKPEAVENVRLPPQSNGFMQVNQDEFYHFGEVLHDMQLDNRHVNFLPRGLSNKGNWCYINATLQALLACPPFYNLLSKLPTIPGLKHGKSSTPITDSMVEFVHEFLPASSLKMQVASMSGRKKEEAISMNIGQPFEPVYIYEMLSRLKLNAFEGRQEDTEEFLSCLLNGLHEEMLAAMNSVESKHNNGAAVAVNGNLDEPTEDEEEAWEVIEKKNKSSVTRTTDFNASPVSEIFCGRIRSALHAVSKSSVTLQPFFTLQLDIQSENVRSVKEALQGLVIKESLQDYHCSKTKQEVAASRQITLEELPPILILHLKRFVYDKDGGGQKLSKKIEFTIDLDLSKELLSPTVKAKLQLKQRSYKLIAVVHHCGGEAAKGHYVADVYHHGFSAWLRTDDARVLPISESKVLNHPSNMVPYLLFYRRQDTIHSSGIARK